MKICAIICEYNPFHNGHLYGLREAKRRSGADALLCIMSGNFVQRGESTIMDKYTRAKHALQAGADVVIELPTVFATANAELFAKGAVSILSAIPSVNTLCFGCENADKTAFKLAARYLNNEPKEVSAKIKKMTSSGMSYAKARASAWAGYIPLDLLCSPNNILGLEYTRAILASNANIDILPIQRVGNGYNEAELNEQLPSATAIRNAIKNGNKIENQVPKFVLQDLPTHPENLLETLEKHAILAMNKDALARVCDCTEGLENAFKRAAETPVSLAETLTSARYTTARIRRIALQALLGIEENLIKECLQNSLYLKLLAIKKENTALLKNLASSDLPIVARAHDEDKLNKTAKKCFEKDLYAEKIYKLLYPQTQKGVIFH